MSEKDTSLPPPPAYAPATGTPQYTPLTNDTATQQPYPAYAPPPQGTTPQQVAYAPPISYTQAPSYSYAPPVAPQQTTYIVQPGGGQMITTGYPSAPVNVVTIPYGPPPPDSCMIFSILTCLFCFFPTGIAAIYYSNEVDECMRRQDRAGAIKASSTAKKLNIAGVIIGVIIVIVSISLYVGLVVRYTVKHITDSFDEFESSSDW